MTAYQTCRQLFDEDLMITGQETDLEIDVENPALTHIEYDTDSQIWKCSAVFFLWDTGEYCTIQREYSTETIALFNNILDKK